MERKEIRVGITVRYKNRNAEITKIKGLKACVKPYGESSRWVKISDLTKVDA